MKVKSESEVAQSCLTLSDPWTAAYQAPPSMGFSRQEYWSGMPLPSPDSFGKCIYFGGIPFVKEIIQYLSFSDVFHFVKYLGGSQFFIHSSFDRHLDCFLTVAVNVAIYMGM